MAIPSYWKTATRELSQRDPVIRKIARESHGLTLRSRGDAFNTLVRSIVGQQISVKAAESIWQRVAAGLPAVTPQHVHAHGGEALRGYGLSRGKVLYLQDLALHFLEDRLTPKRWKKMDDEALIAQLVQVKGIGRWTAEMFLIFHLNRPDVFPIGDLGLVRALEKNYNAGKPLSKRKLKQIETRWRPWRSVATWYMWCSLDPVAVEY